MMARVRPRAICASSCACATPQPEARARSAMQKRRIIFPAHRKTFMTQPRRKVGVPDSSSHRLPDMTACNQHPVLGVCPELGGGMTDNTIDRRKLLFAGAIAGTVTAAGAAARHDGELGAPPQTIKDGVPWTDGTADLPDGGQNYSFFTAAEQAFIEPAIDRLIPKDPTGPSGTEANVHVFLDRQMGGPYGRGDHFFLGGPWPKGTPEQGYQSRLPPAQLYRAAIPAIEKYVSGKFSGKSFKQLAANDQDTVLKGLEAGTIKLDGADGKSFFTLFLQNTLEGYFSDPIYGGNKDMAAWKMIGFPGAHYDYSAWVARHGERVPYPSVGFKGRPGWREA